MQPSQRYCFICKHNNHDINAIKQHYNGLDVTIEMFKDPEMCITFNSGNSADKADFLKRNQELKNKQLADSNAMYTPLWTEITVNNGPFLESYYIKKANLKTKQGADVSLENEFLYIALAKYDETHPISQYHKHFQNSFNSYTRQKFVELDNSEFKNSLVDTRQQQSFSAVLLRSPNDDTKDVSVPLMNYMAPFTSVTLNGDIIPAIMPEDVTLNIQTNHTVHEDMSIENSPGSCWSAKWNDPITNKMSYCFLQFPDPMEISQDYIDGFYYIKNDESVLSNCYRCKIVYRKTDDDDIREYPSVEHAYQGLRFARKDIDKFISGGLLDDENDEFVGLIARNALENNTLNNYGLTPLRFVSDDIWNDLKDIMGIKFKEERFQKALLATGKKYLVYQCEIPENELEESCHDEQLGCWFVNGQLIGENYGGVYLMKIRDELAKKKKKNPIQRIEFDDNDEDDDDDSERTLDSYPEISDDDQDNQQDNDEQEEDDVVQQEHGDDHLNVLRNMNIRYPLRRAVDDYDDDDYYDNQPDFESLDDEERLYLPIGYVLSKIQQMTIIYNSLKSRNFNQLSKVNNAVITQMADEMFVLITSNGGDFDKYVRDPKHSSIVAFLKYAEQRESPSLENNNHINE
jgi:hypothetical protein